MADKQVVTIETSDDVSIPVSVDNAEEALLGIFMQDEDAAEYIAKSGLREDHFVKRKNRHIFSVILNTWHLHGTCNFDFVVDACEKYQMPNSQTLMDFIGGPAALTQIIATPLATDIKTTEGYVGIVLEQSKKIKIKEQGRLLSALAEFDEAKILDAISNIQSVVADTSINKHGLVSVNQLLPDAYARFEDRVAHPEKYEGLRTGFGWIDLYGAVQKKKTCIVAARTNIGKSVFAANMATEMMAAGHRVLLYTPELDKEEYIDRIVCSSQHIPLSIWKKNPTDIREHEVDKVKNYIDTTLAHSSNSLYIDDKGSQSVNYIIGSIRRHMLSHVVDVVIVDYIQRLKFYSESLKRSIDDAIDKLASFAKENNIALIVVSQLRRSKDANFEPRLEDLKESGNLENVADSVVLLHRPSTIRLEDRADAYYVIAKNRSGEVSNGNIPLNFDIYCLKFTEKTPPPDTSSSDDDFKKLDDEKPKASTNKIGSKLREDLAK